MDALWWHREAGGVVACDLCPIGCRLRAGQDGPCATRGNRDGRMVALNYGRVVALGVDPIEKKPLYHFRPGTAIVSAAGAGCNLHCLFCQNAAISQRGDAASREMTPEALVAAAIAQGTRAIAYTYSEPLVWYEFVLATAQLARAAGLANVVVSNGYLEPEPLTALLPWLDAANIDLKAMDDAFYRRICRARLAPVLAAIAALHSGGVHLEITNLVIPGENDGDDAFRALASYVAGIDRTIPLHLSAYHPSHRFTAPPTPPATLLRGAEICAEQLDYVYVGNVVKTEWSNTRCPACAATVIERTGYRITVLLTDAGGCPECGCVIPVRRER